MKKVIQTVIAILFCPLSVLYGQLTIEKCQQLAQENYPLVKQYGLIEKSKEYRLSNANKGYLDQLPIGCDRTAYKDSECRH